MRGVARGVQTIVDAMARHIELEEVQWAGCWALFCLCVHNPAMQEEVAAYGAGQAALRAMQEHRGEARVQEAGCWVIKELAEQIAGGGTKASLPAAAQAATKALERHPGSEPVQTGASSALRKLAAHDTGAWVRTLCLGRCGHLGRASTRQVLAAIQE